MDAACLSRTSSPPPSSPRAGSVRIFGSFWTSRSRSWHSVGRAPRIASKLPAPSSTLACSRVIAPSRAPILLGLKHYEPGLYGEGWGEEAPATISNGGASASGTVSNIHWSSWGGKVAVGRGLNPIFMPQGGYYARPAAIELRASAVKRCTPGGPLVYTRLTAREPSKPGGPFGRWFTWAPNMCA